MRCGGALDASEGLILASLHRRSHRLRASLWNSATIEAVTDGSASDAALGHPVGLCNGAAVSAGLSLPRLEQAYSRIRYPIEISVGSAQAYLSAAASGMMALTGIVFAMAFVMVQFSAIAYSPRLVLWFARDHMLFHALGAFAATFVYALFTLAWVDRGGSEGCRCCRRYLWRSCS